jgi:ethanolamine utilization protein EutQ
MSGVKLFRREDQDFSYKDDLPVNQEPYSILAFVNASNSDTMGGGFGMFGTGSNIEWTVTYDELLFIHSGQFQLKIGDEIFHAGPGDTLWIPKDTPLTYIAEEDVWFFFAVYPFSKSPSGSLSKVYPDAPPRPAK